MDFRGLPQFDDDGLNLIDPEDKLGIKTEYMSLVHDEALRRYLGKGVGSALDVACGYGRMSNILAELGYSVVGVDRSMRVLQPTRVTAPGIPFCAGSLPDLPFADGSFNVVLMQNILRPLHRLGCLEAGWSVTGLIKPGGRLVVVDNSLKGHPEFVDEGELIRAYEERGLRLTERRAIRASRWFGIYLIRYGLVPRRLLPRIARWEVSFMARKKNAPKASYQNVIFVFEHS
jgi:SAM-dependent methyltransferase